MSLNLLREGATETVTDADLVSGGDRDTTYTVRKMTPDKSREIRRTHTKRTFDRRSHLPIDDVDLDAVQDDMLDYVLVDWSGVTDGPDPAPCVRANKLRLNWARRNALLEFAGANAIVKAAEQQADSFRSPA